MISSSHRHWRRVRPQPEGPPPVFPNLDLPDFPLPPAPPVPPQPVYGKPFVMPFPFQQPQPQPIFVGPSGLYPAMYVPPMVGDYRYPVIRPIGYINPNAVLGVPMAHPSAIHRGQAQRRIDHQQQLAAHPHETQQAEAQAAQHQREELELAREAWRQREAESALAAQQRRERNAQERELRRLEKEGQSLRARIEYHEPAA